MKNLFVYDGADNIYKYGSKQVVLKVDNVNQVSVKVGGGFLPVKDFIDRYQKIELDKLRRKDELEDYLNRGQAKQMVPAVSQRSISTISSHNNMRRGSRNKSELPSKIDANVSMFLETSIKDTERFDVISVGNKSEKPRQNDGKMSHRDVRRKSMMKASSSTNMIQKG